MNQIICNLNDRYKKSLGQAIAKNIVGNTTISMITVPANVNLLYIAKEPKKEKINVAFEMFNNQKMKTTLQKILNWDILN